MAKYHIYTDGACNKPENAVSSAFVIVTYGKFIGQESYFYNNANISEAETIAVGLAIDYLLKNTKICDKDEVIIHVDCKSTVKFLSKHTIDSVYAPSSDERIWDTWRLLTELKTKTNNKVSIEKAWAHLSINTANGVADRLAKRALRSKQCLR